MEMHVLLFQAEELERQCMTRYSPSLPSHVAELAVVKSDWFVQVFVNLFNALRNHF